MKRFVFLFVILFSSVTAGFAQNQMSSYEYTFNNGEKARRVFSLEKCTWKEEDAEEEMVVCFALDKAVDDDSRASLILQFSEINKNKIDFSAEVKIYLSNKEVFECCPVLGYNEEAFGKSIIKKYSFVIESGSSSYRESFDDDFKYLLNQLALYDIEKIELYEKTHYVKTPDEKTFDDLSDIFGLFVGYLYEETSDVCATIYPKVKTTKLIKAYIAEVAPNVKDKSSLPDLNNLDRSWSRTPVEVTIEQDDDDKECFTAAWDNEYTIGADDVEFYFELEHKGNSVAPVINIKNYKYILDLKSCWGKKMNFAFKLSNGETLVSSAAIPSPTLTSNRISFKVPADAFADSRTPYKKVPVNYLLHRLSAYDIVGMTINDRYIETDFAASTAECFSKTMKGMLEKTGATHLYSYSTTTAKQQGSTKGSFLLSASSKLSQLAQKQSKAKENNASRSAADAEEIAANDRKAVLLLKYSDKLYRKDHISPRELSTLPFSVFASRDIPLEDAQVLAEAVKGLGKCSVHEGHILSVMPQGFYLDRVPMYVAMPCLVMTIGYPADDKTRISNASFTYKLPEDWKRSDIKKYAKAVSDIFAQSGAYMQDFNWGGGVKGYKCSNHDGCDIIIKYYKDKPEISIYIYYNE